MQNAVEPFRHQIWNSTDNDNEKRNNEEPARKTQKTATGNIRAVIATEPFDTILSQPNRF